MAAPRPSILAWATDNLSEIALALAFAAGIVALLYGVRALILRACNRLGPQHVNRLAPRDVGEPEALRFLLRPNGTAGRHRGQA